MMCKYCNINLDKIIYKSEYWTLCFHKQDYLGRCVLISNRHIDSFSKLTDNEILDFRKMFTAIESELKELFNCTILNWCCNMNNACNKEQIDPHLHIHIRPRYKTEVKVEDIIYIDNEFGEHYDRFAKIQFDDKTIDYIFTKIKNNFKKFLV